MKPDQVCRRDEKRDRTAEPRRIQMQGGANNGPRGVDLKKIRKKVISRDSEVLSGDGDRP
jgi:hypothetical protein